MLSALLARPNWFASRFITRLLGGAWAALLLLRLALLGRGALADYDERRYFQSFEAVRAAAAGNWQACCYALSMTGARPVDAVWRSLPAAAQLALARYAGWDIYDYPSLLVPTLLNWAVTVLAAWYFFRICRWLLAEVPASTQWALVAAVLYASLVNTSLYVRHVLPYDGALLFFFGLLYWVLRQPAGLSGWFAARLGVGAGVLWLFYPGFYAGPVLLVAPLLDWRWPLAWSLRHYRQLLALGAGFMGPLLAAEVVSRAGGAPPFWAVSYDLSLSILQGAPAEGYTFLFKYLWQVEKALGVVLLALLALAVGQAVRCLGREGLAAVPHTPRQKLLVAAALLFLAHATAAVGWHRVVWYGRLLHLYMPFLVLAGVGALANGSWRLKWVPSVALGSCLVGVISYCFFFAAYQQLAYPPDILAAYQVSCLPARQLRYYNELPLAQDLLFAAHAPHAATSARCRPAPADSLTVLINSAFFYPLNQSALVGLPAFGPSARVLFEGPHYGFFPAYTFEGLDPLERSNARQWQLKLRVVRIANLATNAHTALPLRHP